MLKLSHLPLKEVLLSFINEIRKENHLIDVQYLGIKEEILSRFASFNIH